MGCEVLQEVDIGKEVSVDLPVIPFVVGLVVLIGNWVIGVVDRKSVRAGIISHDIVNRDQRGGPVRIGDRVAFVLVGDLRIFLEKNVSILSQPDVILHIEGSIGADSISLQIRIDQRALLIQVAERNIVGALVTSAAGRYGVLLPGGGLEDILEPVVSGFICL